MFRFAQTPNGPTLLPSRLAGEKRVTAGGGNRPGERYSALTRMVMSVSYTSLVAVVATTVIL
jgi:hypothetical protein